MTPELEEKWMGRELVKRVQNLRKVTGRFESVLMKHPYFEPPTHGFAGAERLQNPMC